MAHDFWSKALIPHQLSSCRECSHVLASDDESTWVLETSLTTSAVSRHTLSAQAAGAGSHQLGVGGGGRVRASRAFQGCPRLNARMFHSLTNGVAHQTSLRSQRTMMTRANSRLTGGGSPIHFAGHRSSGPRLHAGIPATGITALPRVTMRDGR